MPGCLRTLLRALVWSLCPVLGSLRLRMQSQGLRPLWACMLALRPVYLLNFRRILRSRQRLKKSNELQVVGP
ncbi:uncharacterized protein Dana_GF26798 [Drosophila ananassae]|uniref:Uncharacterized protein n=1 Tax=Drosophila ananassae TaxID=7217 RepID=A0A0N8NZ64_DROAN|nr:uncharacterized protein Dana_GF26798 [Drosophila ananassae]